MNTLNNKIIAYFENNSILFSSSDYQTLKPEGQEDQIFFWDEQALGKQPTQEQLDAALAVKLANDHAVAYKEKRAAEYPPMADYLDGIVKGDQAQVQAYIDACLAVKAKYPKP
jgi:hypothetical protein